VSASASTLSEATLAAVDAFWAADLGCSVAELRSPDAIVTRQGRGIFILSRAGVVVALPPALPADRVVGPAFIGYADASTFCDGSGDGARVLDGGDGDREAIAGLRAACGPSAWEQGGADGADTTVGIFVDGALATLASYEIWSERIAHIGIITHPAQRGRGLGGAAVAAIARLAIARGLVAQYRTLVANAPSMAIARRLGFQRYAFTLSIRTDGRAPVSGV